MLDILIHVWSKQNKTAIASLALAPLAIGCAAGVPDPPSDTAASRASEETLVTGEPIAPQPERVRTEPAASSSQQPAPADNQLIDIEVGMQYADARARLLKKGWVPAEAPDPGPYGVERMAYDAGFTEVAGCAGTGLGQCRFDFTHPGEQKSLAVITYGGSKLEVGGWNVEPFPSAEAATPANSNPVAQVQSVIPMQFQGEWNFSLEGCGVGHSDGRLVIGLNRIEFYESFGNVQEVIAQGDLKMTVTAEYSSEGETFTRTNSFQLSSDRSTLTHIETGAVRYPCSN